MTTDLFDLSQLGTLRALSSSSNDATLGWLFAFNACENIDTSSIAGHCATNASALAAGTAPCCRTLGLLSSRSVKPLSFDSSRQNELGVTVSFSGGALGIDSCGDTCGEFERSISIDIVCSGKSSPTLLRLEETSTRACSYHGRVESRAGCPLSCARDEVGRVCGGAEQGTCMSDVGARASCVCKPGFSGSHCAAALQDDSFRALAKWAALTGTLTAIICFFLCVQRLKSAVVAFLSTPRVDNILIPRGVIGPVLITPLCIIAFNLDSRTSPTGFRLSPRTSQLVPTCAFTSVGTTFRLGGQSTIVDGAIESYNDQLAATRSHVALLKSMWEEHGLVCDIFFITYNNSFVSDLKSIFASAWPHNLALFRVLDKPRIGFLGLFSQVLDAALPADRLNSSKYEVFHFIRADIWLKPYFARAFDPLDVDRIQFASFIFAQQHSTIDRRGYGKGRPWINEMALSVPRKLFYALRPDERVLRGQDLLGHGKLFA